MLIHQPRQWILNNPALDLQSSSLYQSNRQSIRWVLPSCTYKFYRKFIVSPSKMKNRFPSFHLRKVKHCARSVFALRKHTLHSVDALAQVHEYQLLADDTQPMDSTTNKNIAPTL